MDSGNWPKGRCPVSSQENSNRRYFFRRQTFNSKHRSIVDLIDDAMKKSKENVFCYVKQNSQLLPPFPVRLTHPISHFANILSLQNMCRMVMVKVMQKNFDLGKMDLLPAAAQQTLNGTGKVCGGKLQQLHRRFDKKIEEIGLSGPRRNSYLETCSGTWSNRN